jgi:excinuclease ABC subunit C
MYEFVPSDFPLTPGVYLMKDTAGRIIYVGKAVSLRRRLASYFSSPDRLTAKTRVLVSRVARVDVLLTNTEKEALLLECSLIKKHRPRYNVVMKDDKSYVLIRLDREHPFPRLTLTRRVKADKAAYFGPYTSSSAARDTVKALVRAFGLRRCSDRAMENRSRPCLYHFMGQCPAPCVLPVDQEAYAQAARRAEMVLTGKSGELMGALSREMAALAGDMEFEKAAKVRDLMAALRETVESQAAVLPGAGDVDLAGLAEGEGELFLGLVCVRQGRLMDQLSFRLPGLTLEDGPEALESFLAQFYGPERLIPGRIVLPLELAEAEALREVLSERRGAAVRLGLARGKGEKGLADLARQVAERAAQGPAPGEGERGLAESLARRLHLPGPALRVEGVDASHLAGQEMRVGMVVFEGGQPVKGEYRTYAFPELSGAGDDYAALAAWAARRVAAGPPWPDLVLVDGGLGQLAAVAKGLEEGRARLADHIPSDQDSQAGRGDTAREEFPDGAASGGHPAPLAMQPPALPLAGIAKGPSRRAGELEDRIFLPGRKNPVELRPGSPELLFLQQVRDASHRFVKSRQGRARTKAVLKSELMSLPGVGPKTAKLLWERYASVADMARATPEELAAIPGVGKAKAAKLAAALAGLGAAE